MVRSDFTHFPAIVQRCLDFIFHGDGLLWLQRLQIFVILALLSDQVPDSWAALFFTIIFMTSCLSSLRFRGAFNGGSDAMTLILLSTLCARAWLSGTADATSACLYYIAVQSGLSYAISGIAKIREAGWRSGATLKRYLGEPYYDVPTIVSQLTSPRGVCLVLSWSLIAFELGAVMLPWTPFLVAPWLLLGAAFHLANFLAFGLNRFALIWVATYPALWWALSQH